MYLQKKLLALMSVSSSGRKGSINYSFRQWTYSHISASTHMKHCSTTSSLPVKQLPKGVNRNW